MDAQADERTRRASTDQTDTQRRESAPLATNGRTGSDGQPDGQVSVPSFKRAVTPSTFKLHETPEERDLRIRETRAMLKRLLATTPEEIEEQKETWKILKAALNEDRPAYAKLFPDDE